MTERPAPRADLALAARLAAAALLACAAAPALAGTSGLQLSGSVYVDAWVIPQGAAEVKGTQGITPEASIKIGVDIHDELSFSAKACVSCHGFEFEHAAIDFQPKVWLNAQVGRIAVPFGEFSNRVDPSGHRAASKPLIYDMGRMAYGDRANFNSGVVMLPYTDTGVLLYGQVFLGDQVQVWYGAYTVAGMKGANDVDWMALRSVPYTDNNRRPAYGGRLAATLVSEPGGVLGDLALGASWTGGRFDKDGKLQYDAVAADLTLPLWKATLRGEWALRRTHIDPDARGYPFQVVDPWVDKSGWYAELEHPLGRFTNVVYRYDQLERRGVPLPGSAAGMTPDSRLERWTAGAMITPASSFYLKLSYEFWMPSDHPEFHSVHLGVGGAF